MTKISAFIITKNEATRIARAINSIKNIVDEIIVVDSESTDETVEIAKKLGVRVIVNPWPGYVAQKTFGEELCSNDWILNIDADEELSKELQDEIEYIFASQNQDRYLAYQIKLLIIHRNHSKPHHFAPYNKCIRLYNKKFASFSNTTGSTTHDSVVFNKDIDINGQVYLLNGAAYHHSGISIEQLVMKANFYSGQQAEDLFKTGKIPSHTRIVTEILVCFFKAFFIRRYFIFGFDGFVDSVIFAFARFLRLAKLREKYQKQSMCHSRAGGNPEKK